MLSWIHIAYQIINSSASVLAIELFSLLIKTIFLGIAFMQGLRSPKTHPAWFLLLLAIIGSMFSSFGWIASLSYRLFLINIIDYRIILFVIRITWAFTVIFYQALACFIESLSSFNLSLRWYQKITLILSTLLALGFFYIAIAEFNSVNPRPYIETFLFSISMKYIFILILPSIILTIRRIYRENLPRILRQQLKILIAGIICPVIISDFIQLYPFAFFQNYIASNLAVVSLSSLLITYGFYYSARRVMGLRFLNFQHHVKSFGSFNFVDGFKLVLSQLSYVNSPKDLRLITQNFFKDAFNIPLSRTQLYVRNLDTKDSALESEINAIETIVENFVNRYDAVSSNMAKFFRKIKIAIFDELTFSNFYEESESRSNVLDFLERINADIFIPIYDRSTMIAYIVIERDARLNNFYNDVERDEMVIFASYLGNIINLHQNGNIPVIVQREKEIKEELYRKHQEIEKYKESFRSFLRDTKQRKIGILFYKARHFTFGNKGAQEMLLIDPNKQESHPLVVALKNIVRQVEIYRTSQMCFAKDAQGNKIVVSALPHLEQHNIIITIYYPEISDMVKELIDLLKNPSDWDYLLYLETTKSGQLINQLLPSSGERLLNFKIELMKMSISNKALLLEAHEEDLIATVEILHHLSMRETLHILHLKATEQRNETAIKLFGINPIYGIQQEQPLLEKLNNAGTLFIQNIHFLDSETQLHLVEFLRYGFFHIFKSDHRITSNVRIICSTNQNLKTLVQEGRFSRALFNELKQTTLTMPSLLTLSDQEIDGLIEGFAQQVTKTEDFKNLLQFTDKEKSKIFTNRPVSLQEFKQKIQNIILLKSKKNNILHETQFDPAYRVSDPDLIEAARLGKKALKDPRLVRLLWEKFDKNQNRIAMFLGVNRSSVNRRCKEYNLEVEEHDTVAK